MVEGRLDVGIEHPPVSGGAEVVDLGDGIMRPPPGPKPIGDRQEVGLQDGLQYQLQRSLDHPISDHGNAELADLSRTARLGDHPLPHRQRPEGALLQSTSQLIQKPRDADALLDRRDGDAIDAGRVGAPVTRDPVERHQQRRRIMHQVEQIVEPAAGIGRRLTVKLGLHLRYPPTRPHRDRIRPGADVHRRIIRHCSLLLFSKPLPPLAM